MEEERKRRNVAVGRRISGIKKDDIRVKFIGIIIEKDDSNNSIIVDDEGNKICCLLDQNLFDSVETGKLVRIIGLVVPGLDETESVEIKAEIIQDFSKVDRELYFKSMLLNSSN